MSPEEYRNPSAQMQVQSEPAINATRKRLETLTAELGAVGNRLEQIVNRVCELPPTTPGGEAARPQRAGLVGSLEDIADQIDTQESRLHSLISQLSQHI